jgi:D-alanyl-D-alanine carboxypeptidase (penicillin-binding protein 5/6)
LALTQIAVLGLQPLRAQPSGPLAAPPFDPASPEARLSKKLDAWRSGMATPRPIESPAWILMDPASGRVLAQHNADRKMYPASTTKTLMALTALTALGESGLDRVTTIGPNPPQTGEASIGLLQGERFTIRDLLRAALIKSANDSCVAVAEGVAGNVPAFVKMMNAEARKVGAVHSHFANPHGLHDPNHYTTPRDLAMLARAAMRIPFFNETIATRDIAIHGNFKVPGDRKLVNRNRLLWRWAECDGVKTGYTRQAGRCLVASATRMVNTPAGAEPFRLLAVVMHSKDSWTDSAQLLLHEGFEKFHPFEFAKAGQEFGEVQVQRGASVKAIAPRDISLPLRNGESDNPQQRQQYITLRAPVRSGQVVGNIEFLEAGHPIARTSLVAQDDVPVAALPFVPQGGKLSWAIGLCAVGGIVLLVIGLRGTRSTLNQQEKRYDTSIRPNGQAPIATTDIQASRPAPFETNGLGGAPVRPAEVRPAQSGRPSAGSQSGRAQARPAARAQSEQPPVPGQPAAVLAEGEQRKAQRRQTETGPAPRTGAQGIAAQGRAAQRGPAQPRVADRRAEERRAQTAEIRKHLEAIEQARQAGETL